MKLKTKRGAGQAGRAADERQASRGAAGALALYVRSVAVEFALVVAASVCLCEVALQGFVVAPELQFNAVLLAVLSAVLQALLYAAAYRKQNYVLGIVSYVLASAVLVAVGVATSTGDNPMADIEENHLAFCAVVAVVNALVFLLTRSRRGFLAFVLIGVFTCAFVQYAFRASLVAPSVLFSICAAALIMCRTYALSVRGACEVSDVAHLHAGAVSCAVAIVGALAACAVFALVIAPLSPGSLTLRLFTEYRAFETVEINNPMEIVKVEDPSQTSTNLTSEVIYGDIAAPVTGSDPARAAFEELMEDAPEQMGERDEHRFEADQSGAFLYTFSQPSWWWLLYLLAPVALIAAVVALRKLLRRRTRARIAAHAPAEQVGLVYTALLRRFERLGFGKGASVTPLEYARASAARMEAFAQGPHATWAEISALYEDVHYGGEEPDASALAGMWTFYDGFVKRACNLVGRSKYCFKYFWLL